MARSDWKRPPLVPLADGLKRISLTIAYDGSRFNGWQCQTNGVGVQDVLNEALGGIYGVKVSVQGSGRTDSGVHALGQVCHYDVPLDASSIGDDRVAMALNARLPDSIRVLSSRRVDGSFHARFTTMAREYWYFVKAREDALPFDFDHVGLYRSLPPIRLLDGYARVLEGTHDFTTFACARDASGSMTRDIYESRWCVTQDMFSRPMYRYTVVGNAFLYHQVRSMVGTMMCFALKGRGVDEFRHILEARDRSLAMTTAPSAGLYLSRISYDSDEYSWFEEGHDGKR